MLSSTSGSGSVGPAEVGAGVQPSELQVQSKCLEGSWGEGGTSDHEAVEPWRAGSECELGFGGRAESAPGHTLALQLQL